MNKNSVNAVYNGSNAADDGKQDNLNKPQQKR
jgi:hypothetical protein